MPLQAPADCGINPEFFPKSTDQIMDVFGVTTSRSILDHDTVWVAEAGFSHVVTDSDGVLSCYGEVPNSDTMEHLAALAAGVEHGVSIVSSNAHLDIGPLPPGVSLLRARRPLDYKPSPRLIKQALVNARARAAETVGFGDGLTDMMAYRLAGLGGLCLVKSCGPHPAQEFVHKNIYTPLGALAGAILDKS